MQDKFKLHEEERMRCWGCRQ